MTELKIASPTIAKACWDAMESPSCRRVEEKLKAAGYITPSYRTIYKWQIAGGWKKKPKPPRPLKVQRQKQRFDDTAPALTGDPRTKADDIVQAAIKALPPPPTEEKPEAKPDETVAEDAPEEEQKASEHPDPWIDEVREAIIGNVSDEMLLSVAARTTLRTAIAIEAVLGQMAPQLIAAAPEAVGKLQLAVAESLKAAGEPFDRIGAARERALKTINGVGGEIIPPGSDDPLADSLKAFKTRHAA